MPNQSITVRNPPSRPYVMRATMPFARGEDVSDYGVSFGPRTLHQHRFIARTETHDIYEWCVYNRAQEGRSINARGVTVDQVLIGPEYQPSVQVGKGRNPTRQRGTGGRGASIDPYSGTGNPRDIANLMLSKLEEPDAVYLEISGLGWTGSNNFTTTEIVPLSGPQTYSVRSGDVMWTSARHITTQHFGSFHFWWTVTLGDNGYRLNINWHTGIPRPELLVRSIQLRIRGSTAPGEAWAPPIAAYDTSFDGRWGAWSLLADPAMSAIPSGPDQGFYILKPSPTGKFWHFPRMAQRAWRLALWPAPGTNPGQDPGWGVGDWSGGGFLLRDLKVWSGAVDHIGTDPAATVISKVAQLNADLLATINRSERGDDLGTLGDEYSLFPAMEQAYGGPTGSESLYKPFPGWKALVSNERQGLAEHQILQLRLHSRSWTAIYETDGGAVRPHLAHHLVGGSANWRIALAGGAVFAMQSGSQDQYGQWKDAGFGFSSSANRVIRRTTTDFSDRIPLRLQPQGVDRGWGTHQGWPDLDQQHRGIHWPHDVALAWLDADPLSILYLTQEAEIAHMHYWGATPGDATADIRGAWGGAAFPPTQGSPCLWGRAEGWGFAIMAMAAPFCQPTVTAEDSDEPTATRADRWARGSIALFMDASEFVRSNAGVSWHTNTNKLWDGFSGNPPWDAVANNGPFYCAQAFEVAFLTLAAAYAETAWGDDFWVSTRNGARVAVRAIVNEFVRALDETMWGESTAVASAVVVAGGGGHSVGDVLTITDDNLRTGLGSGTTIQINNKAKVVVSAAPGGVVSSVTIAQGGAYVQQPADAVALGGCFTHVEVFNAVVTTPGSGYARNQIITIAAGTPVRNSSTNHARFKITAVDGAGGIQALALDRTGRYEIPPPTSLSGSQFSVGSGTGAVIQISRTGGGSGLRLDLTWASPVRLPRPSAPFKFFPVKKDSVPVPSWTGRASWDGLADRPPRDMLVRTIFDSFAPGTEFNSQALHSESIYAVLAMGRLLGAPAATKLACELVGVADGDVNGIVNALKAYGIGKIGGSGGIHAEFWWPLYAAFGAP